MKKFVFYIAQHLHKAQMPCLYSSMGLHATYLFVLFIGLIYYYNIFYLIFCQMVHLSPPTREPTIIASTYSGLLSVIIWIYCYLE